MTDAASSKKSTVILGAWIRSRRQALRLTQAKLCELADIADRNTLSRAENGRTRPTELSMLRIAKVLGPPPASVIDAGGYAGIASVLRTLEPSSGCSRDPSSLGKDPNGQHDERRARSSRRRRKRLSHHGGRPISWIKVGGTEEE